MLYEWILELTGIMTGSGYSQNTNIQQTACFIVILIVMYLLFWINHVIQFFFHRR